MHEPASPIRSACLCSGPVPDGPRALIYVIAPNLDLLWYQYLDHPDGTFRWAFDQGKKVGNQWAVKHVFAGDGGVIYTVNNNNDLMWYRHVGQQDGTFTWGFNEGKKVSVGWQARHIFHGGDGI